MSHRRGRVRLAQSLERSSRSNALKDTGIITSPKESDDYFFGAGAPD